MAVKAARKNIPAAVTLERKDGKKAKGEIGQIVNGAGGKVASAKKTSDAALLALLRRLRLATNPTEIRRLSAEVEQAVFQVERVIFHNQFKSA